MTIPARMPSRDHSYDRAPVARPSYNRANTGDNGRESTRDFSPAPRISRMPTEPTALLQAGRSQLRPTKRGAINTDVFTDASEDYETSSPDRYYNDRADSPTTSYGSVGSRSASFTNIETGNVGSIKKGPPPPPPPSRAKKPAPPPPPMKRSTLSTSEIPQA